MLLSDCSIIAFKTLEVKVGDWSMRHDPDKVGDWSMRHDPDKVGDWSMRHDPDTDD